MKIGACLSAKGGVVSKRNVCGGWTYTENVFKILYKFRVSIHIYYLTPFYSKGNRWREFSCSGPFQYHFTFRCPLQRGNVYLACRQVSKAPLSGYYPCVSKSIASAYAKPQVCAKRTFHCHGFRLCD